MIIKPIKADAECSNTVIRLQYLDGEIHTLRLCFSQYTSNQKFHQDHENRGLLLKLEVEHREHKERLTVVLKERFAIDAAINEYLSTK
jgi:hypothetical protein